MRKQKRQGQFFLPETGGGESHAPTQQALVNSPLTVPSREYVRDIWHLEKIHVDDDDGKGTVKE